MRAAAPRPDEAAVLAALDALEVLDSGPDPEFDALARTASLVCGTPIALITLVDTARQWFKARVGLPVQQTPREFAFCAHAVLDDAPLVVADACADERFADNPLVTGEPGIRFYAGAPMRLSSGHAVGTLCVIDREPRALADWQREALEHLALVAARALEGRRARLAAEATARESARAALVLEHSADAIAGLDEDSRIVRWNPAAERLFGWPAAEILGRPAQLLAAPEHRAAQAEARERVRGGSAQRYAAVRRHRDGSEIPVTITLVPEFDADGRASRATAFVHDERPHRQAVAALAAGEQRMRRLYEGTPALLCAVDPQGRLTTISDTALARLGYARDELVGRRAWRLVTPASRRLLHRGCLPDIARCGRCDAVELQLFARDGTVVDVLLTAIVEREGDGAAPRLVVGLEDVTLRRRAEQALRRSEEFLERTGRVAGVGGWQLEIDSGAITWSAETRRIHGVAPDYQPRLDGAIDFYEPDARPVIRAAVERAMRSGEPWDLELPLVRADGSRIWVRAVGTLQREPGTPARLVGAFQDVSVRKELEQQLVAKERFLRHVVDSVPGLIAYVGPDRRYAMVNRAYLEWDRGSHGQVVGEPVSAIHDAAALAVMQPQLERAFAGETTTFEIALRRGGTPRAVQVTYVPDVDEAGGRVVGVFSLKVDVTPLRRAEERLRQVMEASPQGMFTADLDGRWTSANAAWLRISGLTREASLGLETARLAHPDDAPRLAEALRAARDDGGIHTSEFRHVRADGRVVWLRSHLTLLRGLDAPDCLVGTVEDVTERRRMDAMLADKSAALARSNEDLERFAYVASHDLQEPLRMVTSYGQLLVRRHDHELSPAAREFLHFMVDGGQRAQALIRDLLALARLDSQARPRQAVALDGVLAATLQSLHLKVAETGARVTHDPLPTVHADPAQMGQLLANLLGNALKFAGPRPPVVHVGAEREPGQWRIRVRDNGIGIEPRFFERVFVMFQRLHLRSEHDGTGIGLALCKKIVERHGGRIGVESVPGAGSTFWFTLPDAPAAQPAADAAARG